MKEFGNRLKLNVFARVSNKNNILLRTAKTYVNLYFLMNQTEGNIICQ